MSALEMMDAQMDSGLAARAADIPPTPAPTAPLELSGAHRHASTSCVVPSSSWLNGQLLAQTVFRLEWMHAPLEAATRRCACLLAVAKTASAVRTLVLRAGTRLRRGGLAALRAGCALQEGLSGDAVAQLKTAEEAVQAARRGELA